MVVSNTNYLKNSIIKTNVRIRKALKGTVSGSLFFRNRNTHPSKVAILRTSVIALCSHRSTIFEVFQRKITSVFNIFLTNVQANRKACGDALKVFYGLPNIFFNR